MNTVETMAEMENKITHYPVMHQEVIRLLDIENRKIVVDCTIGTGAHGLKFFERMKNDAYLVGIDKDEESLNIAAGTLSSFCDRLRLVKDDFSHLDRIFKNLKIEKADAFFFDLGLSTYQLNNPQRGFSFFGDGPLDMRLDKDAFVSAYDLVNNLSENELELIFRRFGEEHYAKKIAHIIVAKRRNEPISTTSQLASLILRIIPRKYKIHPATRIFQALRIAVNRELEALERGLRYAIHFLNNGGKIAVISFHSLEDRIVKRTFRDFASLGTLKILTKKPLLPQNTEMEENSASRSAKLRVAERIS